MVYTLDDITIGFELELADINKSEFQLPVGYKWSDDETIVNSIGKLVTAKSNFGGELNTKPFLYRDKKEWDNFENIFNSLLEVGFTINWAHGFAVHIGIPNIDLEGLKNIFIFSYYCGNYIYRICNIGEWSKWSNQAPIPNYDYYSKVRSCSNFDELKNVLANSSAKGFIRHLINVTSFFKHNTVEFRLFNSTYDFSYIKNSGLFAYKVLLYALNHDEEDFSNIRSYEDFLECIDFKEELAPLCSPLIFSGNQDGEAERYVAKQVTYNTKMYSYIQRLSKDCKKFCLVNSDLFSELIVLKELLVGVDIYYYNSEPFLNLLYEISVGIYPISTIVFSGVYSFLNDVDIDDEDSKVVMLSKILFVQKTLKYSGSYEYSKKEFAAIVEKARDSLIKYNKFSRKLIEVLSSVKYRYAVLNECLVEDFDVVLYQYHFNSKLNIKYLCKYVSLELDKNRLTNNYYDTQELLKLFRGTFFMYSENAYLDLFKVGKVDNKYLYSNKEIETVLYNSSNSSNNSYSIIPPPDDYELDFSKIKIIHVKPIQFMQVQKVYVKKVDKVNMTVFPFLVVDDKYCFGGFGFNWSKDEDFDLWLLSDFSTNNNIYRLSKLIVLYTKSTFVSKFLSRSLCSKVDSYYTNVYTSNSVSMKYRGVADKHKDKSDGNKCLIYTNKFGTEDFSTIKNTYEQWLKKKK